MASDDMELTLKDTSSSEESRPPVKLGEYVVPAQRDKVTSQEIEKHKATLNKWYGMAEKGMLHKDDSMIELAMENIKIGLDELKEDYNAMIENSKDSPDKLKYESELESCTKNHSEFISRIEDFRSKGSDKTITCQDNVPDLKPSGTPSVKSVTTVRSKASSRISSTSVHIAKAKVKEERAKIQLRRLQEQEKIAFETQRIAAENRRMAAENQRMAAENEQKRERLMIQSQLEEAVMEAKVWQSIEDDARSKRSNKDMIVGSSKELDCEAKLWQTIEGDSRGKRSDKNVTVGSAKELDKEVEFHSKTGAKAPEISSGVTTHQHEMLSQPLNRANKNQLTASRSPDDRGLLHQDVNQLAPLSSSQVSPQVNFHLRNSNVPRAQVADVIKEPATSSRVPDDRRPLCQDMNHLALSPSEPAADQVNFQFTTSSACVSRAQDRPNFVLNQPTAVPSQSPQNRRLPQQLMAPLSSHPISPQVNLQASSPQVSQTEDTIAKGIVAAIGQAMHLPKLDHVTFSGNPVDYYFFRNNFESNLDVKAPTAGLKMDFLLHQCKGKARAKIHHCSIYDPEEGFAEAKRILHKNYGDPDIVTLAFTDQLLSFKPLKYEDNSGLEEFALLLKKCVLVLGRIGTLSELNTIERISVLAAKLPKDVWGGWRKESGVIKGKTKKRPTIWDFADFVERESDNKNSYLAKALASKRDDEKSQTKKSTSQRKSNKLICCGNRGRK